jgi:SAM-dependent MidA family methyltransferase
MPTDIAIQSLIRREIQAKGPISFARFMELALYCPNLGYYERPEKRIGRVGDYYTSVSVGPLFGELLAFQFAQWLEAIPGPVQLVEAGTHDGRLAKDILSWLKSNRPELWSRFEYWIVEPSENRQKWQQSTLNEFAAKVRWFQDFPDAVTGVIFSNELLDSLPFQRFAWDAKAQSWFEWRVSECSTWVGRGVPAEPTPAFDIPDELAAALPDGYTVEINSAAAQWWQTAARSLRTGKLLAIDYFLTADELLRPERSRGTARAYRAHHACSNLLANPGEQDITAHVNVTRLQQIGEAEGLSTEPLLTQAAFLTRIFEKFKGAPPSQLKTLIHPEHLGEKFKVFIQTRDHGTSRL